ncbi:MAG: hypothetical protein ACI89J_003782 [Hyphomicrobiaceae bacterium]|jgi:hypothetical protein
MFAFAKPNDVENSRKGQLMINDQRNSKTLKAVTYLIVGKLDLKLPT